MIHTNDGSDVSIPNSDDTSFTGQEEILIKVNKTVYSVKETLKKSNIILNNANETLSRNDRMTSLSSKMKIAVLLPD